jgi:hypothetical protein
MAEIDYPQLYRVLNILAAIRGFIRNGMNNYEIIGVLEDPLWSWQTIQAIRNDMKTKDDEIYTLDNIKFYSVVKY